MYTVKLAHDDDASREDTSVYKEFLSGQSIISDQIFISIILLSKNAEINADEVFVKFYSMLYVILK